jgi:L-arabinose isomerase
MPSLPVARVMWKPFPSLEVGAECWILADGAHHTVLSYGIDAAILRDWARIVNIEHLHIGQGTETDSFEHTLLLSGLICRRA